MDKSSQDRPIRLCIIVNPSIGLTLAHGERFAYMQQRGIACSAICGPGPEHEVVRKMGVRTHVVHMERFPSPLKDLWSLILIWWWLLWHRFDVVHVTTPKAGLLGALAARLSGHRHLVYSILGRPYENMTGKKRWLLSRLEKLICRLSERVYVVSEGLRRSMVEEGLCPEQKICRIGRCSTNGIDANRYSRSEQNLAMGKRMRRELGIADDDFVILFVGWLRKDKGVNELIDAFRTVAERFPKAHLLLLGKILDEDPLEPATVETISHHPRIHQLDWRPDPAPAYAASDLFAFPSYREGLPNVCLEASAMNLPVVASDIRGVQDAVDRDVTGLLVPWKDPEALAAAIIRLIEDPELCRTFGANGRRMVEDGYRREPLWDGFINLYRELTGLQQSLLRRD
jgi:glycosyltransferase involved in cell wall biosynthesis